MPDEIEKTPDVVPPTGWRVGDVPGWSLALGLILFAAIALALASAGGVLGIVAVAVVQGAVIYLLYTWCAATAPPSSTPPSSDA